MTIQSVAWPRISQKSAWKPASHLSKDLLALKHGSLCELCSALFDPNDNQP